MYTNAEKLAGYQVSQPQLEEHCTPRGYINSLSLIINRWLRSSQRGSVCIPPSVMACSSSKQC